MVDTEKLYKRLTNRDDLKGISVLMIIKICLAIFEELPMCIKEEQCDE